MLERTSGNPFFVGELVRALRDQHILVAEEGHWTLVPGWEQGEIPPTVEGLLASRIDLLPRPAADLLQTASVIGRIVRVPLLSAVRQDLDPARELEVLLARGFLDRVPADGEETLAFHHALVQDVAYARLLRRQRRDLHRQVADVAEAMYGSGDDVVDLLARHLYLGEAGAKAIDYLVRAGERALGLYANEEAIVHFGRAAELADREPDENERRLEIQLALADLHDLVGRLRRSRPPVRARSRRILRHPRLARAERRPSQARRVRGRPGRHRRGHSHGVPRRSRPHPALARAGYDAVRRRARRERDRRPPARSVGRRRPRRAAVRRVACAPRSCRAHVWTLGRGTAACPRRAGRSSRRRATSEH